MCTALRSVLAGDRPVRTLAVGALLSSLGVFVLPGVFVAGFYGRVLARSAVSEFAAAEETSDGTRPANEPRPMSGAETTVEDRLAEWPLPTFSEWRALGVHGLKTWTVSFLYIAAAGLLAVVLGIGALTSGAVVGNGTGAALGLLAAVLLGLTVVGVLSLPAWFFMPVALARLALTGRIGPALEARTVLRTAVSPAYLRRWVPGIACLAVGWAVYLAFALGAGLPVVDAVSGVGVPFAGHLVGASVNFGCQVVAFTLFGRGYAAAVRRGDHDPLLSAVATEVRPPRDEGWGHDGRLPAWGELRRGRATVATASD